MDRNAARNSRATAGSHGGRVVRGLLSGRNFGSIKRNFQHASRRITSGSTSSGIHAACDELHERVDLVSYRLGTIIGYIVRTFHH